MNTKYASEEIWLARICLVLGAGELVDALSNFGILLRLKSDLNLTAPGTMPVPMVIAYTLFSLAAGLYLTAGGAVFSRFAFKREVPIQAMCEDFTIPHIQGILSVAFRGYGASHFLSGLMAFVRHGVMHFFYAAQPLTKGPPSAVDFALGLQHVVIGTFLLYGGGAMAGIFFRKKQINNALGPTF